MGVNSLTRDTLSRTVKYNSMLADNSVYDVSAMEPIATYLANGSTYAQFTNIPQNYQDLLIIVNARGVNTSNGFGTAQYLGTYANGDPSSCSATSLRGDGASATSTRVTNQSYFVSSAIPNSNAGAGIYGSVSMNILNYSNTTTYKTILTRSAFDMNGSGQTWLTVTLYSKTAAISSLTIYDPSASGSVLAAGSTVTLYGIRAVR